MKILCEVVRLGKFLGTVMCQNQFSKMSVGQSVTVVVQNHSIKITPIADVPVIVRRIARTDRRSEVSPDGVVLLFVHQNEIVKVPFNGWRDEVYIDKMCSSQKDATGVKVYAGPIDGSDHWQKIGEFTERNPTFCDCNATLKRGYGVTFLGKEGVTITIGGRYKI